MVYITSDLFGPPASQNLYSDIYASQQTTMANPQYTAGLGKRKRIFDDDTAERRHGSVQQLPHINAGAFCANRSAMPSWNRPSSPPHHTPHLANKSNPSLPYAVYSPRPSDRRPLKQMKRFIPKSALTQSTSHLMEDIETEPVQQPAPSTRPCHVCNSAPKRKKDLVNYLDCTRCSERTCYICARECVGGCEKAICKKCTVEVGEEGDAWCLDCYSRNINL